MTSDNVLAEMAENVTHSTQAPWTGHAGVGTKKVLLLHAGAPVIEVGEGVEAVYSQILLLRAHAQQYITFGKHLMPPLGALSFQWKGFSPSLFGLYSTEVAFRTHKHIMHLPTPPPPLVCFIGSSGVGENTVCAFASFLMIFTHSRVSTCAHAQRGGDLFIRVSLSRMRAHSLEIRRLRSSSVY